VTAQIISFRAAAGPPLAGKFRRYDRAVKETARCLFEGDLYRVDFHDEAVRQIRSIRYRIANDGAQEMKRYCWEPGSGRNTIDDATAHAIASAARLVLAGGKVGDVDDTPHREKAVASLHCRRAKLARQVEMIDATIASMKGESN
jgi:hypothetical protein